MDGPLTTQQDNGGYLVSCGYDNKIKFDKFGKHKGGRQSWDTFKV